MLIEIKNIVELLLFFLKSGIMKVYEEKNACNVLHLFSNRDGDAVRGAIG